MSWFQKLTLMKPSMDMSYVASLSLLCRSTRLQHVEPPTRTHLIRPFTNWPIFFAPRSTQEHGLLGSIKSGWGNVEGSSSPTKTKHSQRSTDEFQVYT